MSETPTLQTDRLLLRPWRQADLAPLAEMNADPKVMAHIGDPLTRAESDLLAQAIQAHFDAHGYGLWAVELEGEIPFAGFVGLLHRPAEDFAVPFAPCVEVGWRLARAAWDRGIATEAARAAMTHGFETVGLDEIVSFTVPGNQRSRRVMERLGMRHDEGADFDHPNLPTGHPHRRHVLYRMRASEWATG